MKANQGAAGVDEESIQAFEANLAGNLYKLWNRLCSGSYMPPPVKAVELPKRSGGSRVLGVPTVADRVAQTVVRLYLVLCAHLPRWDELVHIVQRARHIANLNLCLEEPQRALAHDPLAGPLLRRRPGMRPPLEPGYAGSEALDEPRGQPVRTARRDMLSDDRADTGLEGIPGARNPSARAAPQGRGVSGRGDVLDLRTYRLKPGAGEIFGRIFRDALPMLTRSGIDVITHGTSLDDSDLYYLVRSFGSAAERDERLDAFYGSDKWRSLHRDRVLALIESHHVLLLPAQPIHDGLSG